MITNQDIKNDIKNNQIMYQLTDAARERINTIPFRRKIGEYLDVSDQQVSRYIKANDPCLTQVGILAIILKNTDLPLRKILVGAEDFVRQINITAKPLQDRTTHFNKSKTSSRRRKPQAA